MGTEIKNLQIVIKKLCRKVPNDWPRKLLAIQLLTRLKSQLRKISYLVLFMLFVLSNS